MKEKTETSDSGVTVLIALVTGAVAALAAFVIYIVNKAKSIVNEDDKPE
jgi:hypothetical protein